MKNHEFQRLVDQTLSGLVWDEGKRRRTLSAAEKEERPVRKFSRVLILATAILCLSLTALAAELIFSRKMSAIRLAEKALEEDYGVTISMLSSFFGREAEEQEDGSVVVTYSGDYRGVLGAYTVVVREGKASATWSHDGEDTSGMFEAEAWGTEQLKEMLRLTEEEHSVVSFAGQAKEIAQRRDEPAAAPVSTPSASPGESWREGEAEAKAAASSAGRTEEELLLLAKEGAAQAYALAPEQRALLIFPFTAEEQEALGGGYLYYHVQDGVPLFTVMLTLTQHPSADPNVFPPFTEKDGVYWVDVNVSTGAIESVLYDSQLGGNG